VTAFAQDTRTLILSTVLYRSVLTVVVRAHAILFWIGSINVDACSVEGVGAVQLHQVCRAGGNKVRVSVVIGVRASRSVFVLYHHCCETRNSSDEDQDTK
jgi:hypothetical protein